MNKVKHFALEVLAGLPLAVVTFVVIVAGANFLAPMLENFKVGLGSKFSGLFKVS